MQTLTDRTGAKATMSRLGPDAPRLWTRLGHDALQRLAISRFYRHTLIGGVPADLKFKPGLAWPGDPKRGIAIASGEIELAGELVRSPSPRWFPPSAGMEWLAEWHGFGWISDLFSAGTNAREAARELVQSWLAKDIAWHAVAWRSDVLATRLFAWITHFDDLAGRDQDPASRRAMLASLAISRRPTPSRNSAF